MESSGCRKSEIHTSSHWRFMCRSGGRSGSSSRGCDKPMRHAAKRDAPAGGRRAGAQQADALAGARQQRGERQRQARSRAPISPEPLSAMRSACWPRHRARTTPFPPLPIRARAQRRAATLPIGASRWRWKGLRRDSGGTARRFRRCPLCAAHARRARCPTSGVPPRPAAAAARRQAVLLPRAAGPNARVDACPVRRIAVLAIFGLSPVPPVMAEATDMPGRGRRSPA